MGGCVDLEFSYVKKDIYYRIFDKKGKLLASTSDSELSAYDLSNVKNNQGSPSISYNNGKIVIAYTNTIVNEADNTCEIVVEEAYKE